jgi:type I restriction enzyme, S subunit
MTAAKYSAYKPSGLEWLGDVPSHWRIDRLKASITLCRNGIWGDEPQGDENDIPCVRVADFDRQKLRVELDEPTIRNVTDKERTGRLLSKGELLLEKSGGGENQPVGCVVLYDDARPAVCSNFVARVVPAPGQNSSYWRYVHAAAYAVRLTVGSINQTSGIQNLDQARYFNEYAAFPPHAEQIAIATFLDSETAKIDALVEEQRRLIELLKEKRQAVISQAVTKGLDPSVPMKDSGVEWLGEVPAHWKVGKSGFYVTVLPGYAFSSADFSLDDSDTKLLRGINVGVGELRWEEVVYWARKESDDLDAFELSEGDVVIGMDRPLISSGMRVALVSRSDLPCLLLQRVAKVHPGPVVDRRFVMRLLSSRAFEAHFAPETTGVSVPHISGEQICSFVIPVPPLDEQRRICDFVEGELANLDALHCESEFAISLLGERRSALISAAVTGKIDVRGLAPQ